MLTKAAGSGVLSRHHAGHLKATTVRQHQKTCMTRFTRSSLEVAVAVGTIMLVTVIVHVIVSWWPTLKALI
jgi:hypothetical protein